MVRYILSVMVTATVVVAAAAAAVDLNSIVCIHRRLTIEQLQIGRIHMQRTP